MKNEQRNAWTPQDFRRVITKAGRAISCSWGVAGIRDKKTGKQQVTLMFNDDDHDQFAYAFCFESIEEVEALCHDLIFTAAIIKSGEPPKEEELI